MFETPEKYGSLSVPREKMEQLLSSIVQIANTHSMLVDRRQATLELLLDLLGASVGHWAWGYGDVVTNGVLPVGLIVAGYTPEQLAVFNTMSLDTECMKPFRMSIYNLMQGNHHSTVHRGEIFADEVWRESPLRRYLQTIKLDEWVHSVRYQSANVWSNMMLLRNTTEPQFDAEDTALLDIAMQSISWLHATAEESIPKEMLVELTDRKRLITLLLLDGLSRKLIAANLQITEDTVGDHIKSIFRHFKVNSATELAAIFLRSK